MKKFFYRVKNGDCLLSISNRFNECVFKIIQDNCLNKEVQCGDILLIESSDSPLYLVKPYDTLESISIKFKKDKNDILQENNLPYLFCGLKIRV